jgi:hypothetical protein
MTTPISIYREKSIDCHYYRRVEDENWNNFHTIFLNPGSSDELIPDLLDINPNLNLLHRPSAFSPKAIFKELPHCLITDDSSALSRQFYIEDYLDEHLGWKDKKTTTLYTPLGYDVFLISHDKPRYRKWMRKPSLFGLERLSILDYQIWLKNFPGNG